MVHTVQPGSTDALDTVDIGPDAPRGVPAVRGRSPPPRAPPAPRGV